MKANEKPDFFKLMADVQAFYGKDFSEFAGRVWWEAMKPYDFAAVADALNRHCVNPDSGQYAPKPADVVKMLQGSTQDSALGAWAKVDRAVRVVGCHRSVVFDDALIHRVIADMGGWVLLGTKTESEWPFTKNEFIARYRGFKMRSEAPDYPGVLIGISQAVNSEKRVTSQPPVLLGNPELAQRVMAGATNRPALEITSVARLLA